MDIHTQLITAANQGNATMVQHCLDNGADPLFWDSHALTRAVTNNHIDIVKLLIPVSDVNAFNAVALRTAMDLRHHDIVDLLWELVDHASIMSQYPSLPSPLYVACQNGLFDRALSVLHHKINHFAADRCLDVLNKNPTDPKELKIWEQFIQQCGPQYVFQHVEDLIQQTLPCVDILIYIYTGLSAHDDATALCQKFLKKISTQGFATHHIASLYPLFKDLYPTLEDSVKIKLLSQTLQSNILFSNEMIEHCKKSHIQLLTPEMMSYALKGDMSVLNYCLNVWGSQHWVISGEETTEQYNKVLTYCCNTGHPEKVLRVLEEHPQFHTPEVLNALLKMENDDVTVRIRLWVESEEKALFNIVEPCVWTYWQDYKNREQKAIIEQHVDTSASTHSRKM